jgi:hypothetical protein
MNCETFETMMEDLARGQVTDEATRNRALAHGEDCARCRARLAGARACVARLKMLAAADEARSAPPVVEAVLLAAFRRQADAAGVLGMTSEPARPRGLRLRWAWAAAALLLAAGWWAYRAMQSPASSGDRVTIRELSPAPSPSVLVNRGSVTPPPAAPQRPRALLAARRGGRKTPATPLLIRDSVTSYAGDYEETTEFVSVNYEESQIPIESGQVIRVRMPRSALARFGLPVNLEQADVPVKADVLVGEDGLARAIRFIR